MRSSRCYRLKVDFPCIMVIIDSQLNVIIGDGRRWMFTEFFSRRRGGVSAIHHQIESCIHGIRRFSVLV